jgi:hypothetical protein
MTEKKVRGRFPCPPQGWQTWFFKFLVFYGFLEKPGFCIKTKMSHGFLYHTPLHPP